MGKFIRCFNRVAGVVLSCSMLAADAPEEAAYSKEPVAGELSDYAKKDEAFEFALTGEEYDRINNKFGGIHSVAAEVADINIKPREKAVLPDKADVVYSDGSRMPMNVKWDTAGKAIT